MSFREMLSFLKIKFYTMKPLVKTAVALSAGLALGAVAGVLLAPRKGEETRRIIRKKSQLIADRVQQKARDGKKLVTGVKDDLIETLNGIQHKATKLM